MEGRYERDPRAGLKPRTQDRTLGNLFCMAPFGESEAEASSCPRASALSSLGMFLWLFSSLSSLFFHKEPTTLHSSSQICSSACWEINNSCRPFQIQFLEDSLFPLSQLKEKKIG